ncbi:PKS-NRPS hybrid synthetase cheA-like [Mercurialis annua]|uniref:PKS-NRPS hybrid synthetase cheA-like n=1 Tax=Mercurialis annua TaxID=3986 RepID=UPI00215EDF5D|nr:PKS-NRPS hybrid synthetase cheA-like [Mercurialis annua]
MAQNSHYVHWTLTEEDTGVVTHLFMGHLDLVRLLHSYYWIIGIDSTYKTNKYKLPFFEIIGMTPSNKNFIIADAIMKDETERSYRWVLERLRCLIGEHIHLSAILTDKELGQIRPVSEVFPRSSHRLCIWHINKDVEDRVYRISGKNKEFAEIFKNRLIQYIEGTWLVHREKFVSYWTNLVLHFGNTTTCRVESAHTQLKQLLNSSTGTLDTVWTKVDKVIESQLIDIRKTLEDSRRTIGIHRRGFPFDKLSCRVSHYCLDLISKELRRMRGLSTDVYDRCGCVLRSTHQIPCACELRAMVDSGNPISLDSMYPFWMKLVILGDGMDTSAQADYASFRSEEHQYFHEIAEEVMTKDPLMLRDISRIVRERLHPEDLGYREPEVKNNVKGRPKGSKSTKRDPSRHEYKDRVRGRLKSSQGQQNPASTSASSQNAEVIPRFIFPFVEELVDVCGDGNCGFRVVADYIYGDQEMWGLTRMNIANELSAHPLRYDGLCVDGLEAAITRINWEGESCGPRNWMQVWDDLYPIATLFNKAVIYIQGGTLPETRFGSCSYTVLSLHSSEVHSRSSKEIVILYISGRSHFVRLNLQDNFHVPPITSMWFNHRDRTVMSWDTLYGSRRD